MTQTLFDPRIIRPGRAVEAHRVGRDGQPKLDLDAPFAPDWVVELDVPYLQRQIREGAWQNLGMVVDDELQAAVEWLAGRRSDHLVALQAVKVSRAEVLAERERMASAFEREDREFGEAVMAAGRAGVVPPVREPTASPLYRGGQLEAALEPFTDAARALVDLVAVVLAETAERSAELGRLFDINPLCKPGVQVGPEPAPGDVWRGKRAQLQRLLVAAEVPWRSAVQVLADPDPPNRTVEHVRAQLGVREGVPA